MGRLSDDAQPAGTGTYAPLDARDTSITTFTAGMLVSSGSAVYKINTTHAAPFDSTKATQLGGTLVASITDGDTTHAPTADAVYDALALKGDATTLGVARFRTLPGIPVTNNNSASNLGAAGTAGTARIPHIVASNSTDIRLVYQNAYPSAGVDTDGPYTLTIRASIEVSGTIYRATFDGLTTCTLDPGGLVISDPIAVDLTAGSTIYTRTYSSGTAVFGNTASFVTTSGGGYTATTDLTAPGSGAIAASVAYMFGPCAVLGTPNPLTRAGVALIGDSIFQGSGDASGIVNLTTLPGGGYGARALIGVRGMINLAVSGEKGSDYGAVSGHFRRARLTAGCTHAICEYGVNDYKLGNSLATIQASNLITWKFTANRGVKVFQTTLTPNTTSTDSWATTANQTLVSSAQNTVRVNYNNWLRAGAPIDPSTLAAVAIGTSGALLTTVYNSAGTIVQAASGSGHPLTGVFEAADLAESARDSGLWHAGWTTDGLHPNGTGAAAIAACIIIAALV